MWKSLTRVTLNWGWLERKECLGDLYHEYSSCSSPPPLPVIAGLKALSHDQGVMDLILCRLDEGDLELGRVSELEVFLPAPAGRIKCVSLQVLMIITVYPGKL